MEPYHINMEISIMEISYHGNMDILWIFHVFNGYAGNFYDPFLMGI
jgi:hypothetical protein